MEEPLLSAIVTNKPEPAIPHQPLNRPVRHVDNLRGPCPHDPMDTSINFRSAFFVLSSCGTVQSCTEIDLLINALGEPSPPCGRGLQRTGRRLQGQHFPGGKRSKLAIGCDDKRGEAATRDDAR
jgi:hypothetical protein